jgi:hypothetical protein
MAVWTPPPNWSPGDILAPSELNTYVRDNSDYLIGPRTWTAPAYVNGWQDYGFGYAPVGYRKVGDRTFLRGMARNLAASAANMAYNIAMFTLPAGFRPAYTLFFSTLCSTGGVQELAVVEVFPTGVVSASVAGATAAAGDTWVSLDGMRFDGGT